MHRGWTGFVLPHPHTRASLGPRRFVCRALDRWEEMRSSPWCVSTRSTGRFGIRYNGGFASRRRCMKRYFVVLDPSSRLPFFLGKGASRPSYSEYRYPAWQEGLYVDSNQFLSRCSIPILLILAHTSILTTKSPRYRSPKTT